MTFDYNASAELIMPKRKGGARQPLGYRRFATAKENIRFAVEDFPAMCTLGAWMRVGDERSITTTSIAYTKVATIRGVGACGRPSARCRFAIRGLLSKNSFSDLDTVALAENNLRHANIPVRNIATQTLWPHCHSILRPRVRSTRLFAAVSTSPALGI